MKKIIVMTLFVLSEVLTMSAQKIAKDEIDKFTKQRVIETKQEELIKRNKWKNQWQRILISIRNVNGEWVMPAFIELEEIEKYDDESTMTLLLDNGESIILESLYTGIGAEDCPIGIGGVNSHVHGFSTVFNLSETNLNMLRAHEITDIRVSPLGKNYDFVVGDKEKSLISRSIGKIDNLLK